MKIDDFISSGATREDIGGLPTSDNPPVCTSPLPPAIEAVLDDLRALGPAPDLGKVTDRLRLLAPLLSGADGLDRARARAELVAVLKALGVAAPATFADAALTAGPEPDAGQGRGIAFDTVEPVSEPVDGAALLSDVAALVRRHVVMDLPVADACALWIAAAHVHESADCSPIAAVVSPVMRCGKSTLLRLMRALVPRPLVASNISPSAVFRAIEAFSPTLIVDEADSFLAVNDELRGILNSGHDKDMAFVIRNVGEDHEPRQFKTWCPKVIALIGSLPATLRDRSITLPLRRRLKSEPVERLPGRNVPRIVGDLPARLARWGADSLAPLGRVAPPRLDALGDRENDNWSSPFAIAALVGGPWPARARAAALALAGQGEDPDHEEAAVAALRAVGAILAKAPGERMASADLIGRLAADPASRWSEYYRGKPITQRQLARLLGRFDVKPRVIRLPSGSTPSGYRLEDLGDALGRYATHTTPGFSTSDPQHAEHANDNGHMGPISHPQQTLLVEDGKSKVTPREGWHIADVEDENPETRESGESEHGSGVGEAPESGPAAPLGVGAPGQARDRAPAGARGKQGMAGRAGGAGQGGASEAARPGAIDPDDPANDVEPEEDGL